MWIFTKNAVLSVVEYDPTNGYADDGLAPKDDSQLWVRARQRSHLVDFGFGDHEVTETPENDYPFRALALRHRVAAMVANEVMGIDYGNYKNAAQSALPYPMLSEVWASVRLSLDSRELHDTPF